MPLIECTVIKGYDGKTRQTLAERITDAACSATGAHPDFVVVTINELDSTNYMRGRVRRKPAPAPENLKASSKAFKRDAEARPSKSPGISCRGFRNDISWQHQIFRP